MKDRDERLKRIIQAKIDRDTSILIDALSDDENRDTAMRYLVRLQATEAVPAIIRATQVANPITRANAATALGKLRARDAIPELREMARHDPIDYVRGWAIDGISRIDEQAGVETAVEALSDDKEAVRYTALYVLRRSGTKKELEVLRRSYETEKSWKFRRRYRRAIWTIRYRCAIRTISKRRSPRS